MGLCALPHCFFATIWWRSHLEILAAFYVTRYGATWLGWGYERLLALLVAAVYLYLRGSAFPQTKGEISCAVSYSAIVISARHTKSAAVATEKQKESCTYQYRST